MSAHTPPADLLSALPPGMRTDLGILRAHGSVIQEREDHLVVRSPQNPHHHWGHALFLTTGDPDDAARWLDLFAAAFPQADWVALGLPAAPSAAGAAAYAEAGVELQELDSLETSALPQMRPLPPGYSARALSSPEDWEQLVQMKLELARAEDQYDPDLYEQFARARVEQIQQLCAVGQAAWFGAFQEEKMCSSLGIVLLGEDARYQAVLTSPEHRKRGLAGHLLGRAAQWSAEQGARHWTIVTESDNPAGHLYRSVGFAPAAPSFEAYRAPARTDSA